MADLFAFAFSPAAIAWLLAGGALWLCLRPGSRLVPRLLLTIAVLYLTFSIFAVSFQFERLLVRGYRPLAAGDVPAAVMFQEAEHENATFTWILRAAGAFIMLVGVVTGAYSTVFTAAPLLLVGSKQTAQPTGKESLSKTA